MDNSIINKLIYRRQFFIYPEHIEMPGLFNTTRINDTYYLNYHHDLPYAERESDLRKIYILGNILDPDHPGYSNSDIANYLLEFDFDSLIEALDLFSGRYLIIYKDFEKLILIHDFMSHFKVYWSKVDNRIWCGSQPHVLAKYLNLEISNNIDRVQFFSSDQYKESQYVDFFHLTKYDDIEHLQPNHYLDILGLKKKRYWPVSSITPVKINAVVDEVSELIKGYLHSAANRYKLMIPITAGFDSRLLLAASKEIRHDCLYYINKNPGVSETNIDIQIPKKLLSQLKMAFYILDYSSSVDDDFKDIYINNCQSPFLDRLPLIYNTYFKKYQDYMNIPGNGIETVINMWQLGKYGHSVDGADITRIYKYEHMPFALDGFREWFSEVEPLCNEYNMDLENLLYLEYRVANWATQFQINKDIGQNEVYLFNSRRLITIMLSVNSYYRQENSRIFHIKLVKKLWKQTLSQQINPSFRGNMRLYLERLGLHAIMVYVISKAKRYFVK